MKKESEICYIVGAGEFRKDVFHPEEGAYIIAADGGYAYLKELGIEPDMVVGDFDSLGKRPDHPNVIEHPVMKDDTDLALAAKVAMERGCTELYFYGATGGRLDHTIAAMQLLSGLANQNVAAYLFGEDIKITALAGGDNSTLHFAGEYEGTVSVFASCGKAEGVTLEGLLYPLTEAELLPDYTLGVSNSFTGKESRITIKKGCVWVMWYGNENLPLPTRGK